MNCATFANHFFLRGFGDLVRVPAIAGHLVVGAHCRAVHETQREIPEGHYRYRDKQALLHRRRGNNRANQEIDMEPF